MSIIQVMTPEEFAASVVPDGTPAEYLVALHKRLWPMLPEGERLRVAVEVAGDYRWATDTDY